MADEEYLEEGLWITKASIWWGVDAYLSAVDEDPPVSSVTPEPPVRGSSFAGPEWHNRAKCLEVGAEVFFGKDDSPNLTVIQVRDARQVCAGCPVFVECLTHSLTKREYFGVWAGTTGRERRRIWRLMEQGQVKLVQVVEDYLMGDTQRYQRGAEDEAWEDEDYA